MGDTFIISLPNGDAFSAGGDENLLIAAQRAHWLVRYGCRNGNCEACAARLLKGGVTQRGQPIEAPADILLCLCLARSDLRIDLPGTPQHGSVQQSQRRYVRVLENMETTPGVWRAKFALPAGRQSVIYPGQYALIENAAQPELPGRRFYIDTAHSSGRVLQVMSAEKLSFTVGDYVHLRYPLGYCYATIAHSAVVILFETDHRDQALQLQTDFAKSAGFDVTVIQIKNDEMPVAAAIKLNSGIFACATTAIARAWYEALLERGAQFTEFRCDDAIWRRWRVLRQDDNGNRFTVVSGLSESAARIKAAEMESHGHKQLYWTEPIM